MNVKAVLFGLLFVLANFLAGHNSEICEDTENLQECLFGINGTQLCDEAGSDREGMRKEVNSTLSNSLREMNLESLKHVSDLAVNQINLLILQLYLDMLARNVCQSNQSQVDPESFIMEKHYLDSFLITPLENSGLISSGMLYMLESKKYFRTWKNYKNLTATEDTLPPVWDLDPEVHSMEAPKKATTKMSIDRFTPQVRYPVDFLEIHYEPGENKRVPKVLLAETHFSGPYLKCVNGEYLRLELEIPLYALTNCAPDAAEKFKQVGIAIFDVPLAFIDIDQCHTEGGIRLDQCPPDSYCEKRNFSAILRRDSYHCVCNHSYPNTNESRYSDKQLCHSCHPSCFNCTNNLPCYTQGLRWTLLAWNSIAMFICLCLIVTTIVFSYIVKHDSFASSAPPFLLLILIGSSLMYTTLIVESFPPNIITCTLSAWCFYPGFSLAFGSLIIKSWRIIKIYKEAQKWTHDVRGTNSIDWHLFLRLLPFIFITIITLTAWSIHGTMSPFINEKNQKADFLYCKQDDWNYLILVANLLLILFGVLLSVKARTLPSTSRERETRDILFSIYNITIVNIMCTVVTHTLYFYQQDVNFVVLFVNLHLGISFMIFIMFRKKVTGVFLEIILKRKRKRGNTPEDDFSMKPEERDRFLRENKKLQELVTVKEKQIKQLQTEFADLQKDRQSGRGARRDSDVEISILPDQHEDCIDCQTYDMSIYLYEKRDSATESEIHLEMRGKHEQLSSIASPISTDL